MTAERIAAEVRAEIARQRLPQAAVAKEVGLTPSQFSRRASGAIGFSAAELSLVAEFLNVPVSSLYGEVAA